MSFIVPGCVLLLALLAGILLDDSDVRRRREARRDVLSLDAVVDVRASPRLQNSTSPCETVFDAGDVGSQ
jgi:hypothetical protein